MGSTEFRLPEGVGVCLYGLGLERSTAKALPALAEVQPQIVVLHSSAAGLLEKSRGADGRSIAERMTAIVRACCPGVVVWWEIAGDMPSQVDRWADAAWSAKAAGAESIIINAEEYWKRVSADDAEKAIKPLLRIIDGGYPIGHSAYGWPVWVRDFGGGHEEYPWAAFIGRDGLSFTLPQVYWGRVDSAEPGWIPDRDDGVIANRASRKSYSAAVHKGIVRKGIPTGVYLLSYSTHRADACRIALEYPCAIFWSSDRLEDHGLDAIHALAELKRRGYWRASGVRDFQSDNSLLADDLVGPKTLEALGVPR